MEELLELLAFVGFGFVGGGMIVVYVTIFSTIAGPPRDERDKAKLVGVYLIRLCFIGVAFLSLTILRTLRLAYATHNALAPLLALIIFFSVMVVGTLTILPRFMKVTVDRK